LTELAAEVSEPTLEPSRGLTRRAAPRPRAPVRQAPAARRCWANGEERAARRLDRASSSGDTGSGDRECLLGVAVNGTGHDHPSESQADTTQSAADLRAVRERFLRLRCGPVGDSRLMYAAASRSSVAGISRGPSRGGSAGRP
jgi:hypothetical protein